MKLYTIVQISYNPADKINTFSTKILHLSPNCDTIQKKYTEATKTLSELYKIQDINPKIERVNNLTMTTHDPQHFNSLLYTTEKNITILTTATIETDELPKKKENDKIKVGDLLVLNKDAYSDFRRITRISYEPNLMICRTPETSDGNIEITIISLKLPDSDMLAYLGNHYLIPKTLVHKQELK